MVYDLSDIVIDVELAVALDYYKIDIDTYSSIGKLILDLKYGVHQDNDEKKSSLIKLATYFIDYIETNIDDEIDVIIPIPSYNPKVPGNKSGVPKMMYLFAYHLSIQMGIPLDYESVTKVADKQAKNSFLKPEYFESEKFTNDLQEKNVLLIDDLFGSGDSANYTIQAIKKKNLNAKIFFISATKNKYGGLGKDVNATIDFTRNILETEAGIQYIRLNFMYNDSDEWVNIFDNHDLFPQIQKQYIEGISDIIPIKVKRKENKYWGIV